MEREALLSILSGAFFGFTVWLVAAIASKISVCHIESERKAWWVLSAPVFAGMTVVVFLVGWALQEPDPADEWASGFIWILAAITLVAALRGLWRACLSAHTTEPTGAIATVGIARQKIIISSDYAEAASPEIMEAALTHEDAHRRAHDPFRIWLAQFVADLQWPIPGTQQRLQSWLHALEIQRDDDAVSTGVDPRVLAEAIVLAARQSNTSHSYQIANITGDGLGISYRVRRLLSLDARVRPQPYGAVRKAAVFAIGSCLGLALWLGNSYGEYILSLIPGIGK